MLASAGSDRLLVQQGASLVPLKHGRKKRAFAMCECQPLPNRVGVALSLRAVWTRNHKPAGEMRSGPGELYDLSADPDDTVHLSGDLAAASVRARLENDPNQLPDDAGQIRTPAGTAPPAGPAAASRSGSSAFLQGCGITGCPVSRR